MTDELRDRLAAVDPAAAGVSVDPADSPRAELLRRRIMTTPDLADSSADRPPAVHRSRWSRLQIGLAAAAAAAVVAGGVTTYVVTRPDARAPAASAMTLAMPDSGTASSCINPAAFTPEPGVVAFGGTVASVDEGDGLTGTVVLDIDRRFQGIDAAVTQVKLETAGQQTSESVTFEVGTSYLVSAMDGTVMVCITQPSSDELQSLYEGWYG